MNEIQIFTDLHIGAKHEHKDAGLLLNLVDKIERKEIAVPKDVFLIGDIVERKNILKKDVDKQTRLLRKLKDIFGKNMRFGNHSLFHEIEKYIHLSSGVTLAHGDFELWGERKAIEYRNKEPGCSWLKYHFLVPAFEEIRHWKPYNLKTEAKERIWKVCRDNNTRNYFCGHTHVSEIQKIMFGGIEINLLPRGYHKIKI